MRIASCYNYISIKAKLWKRRSDTKLQHNYVVLLGNGFLMKNSGNEATFVCAPPLVCTVCYWYKAMAEKLQWVLSIRWRRGSSLITAGWWWGGSLSNLSDSWETLCHILSLSRGHPHRHLFCTTEGGNQACEAIRLQCEQILLWEVLGEGDTGKQVIVHPLAERIKWLSYLLRFCDKHFPSPTLQPEASKFHHSEDLYSPCCPSLNFPFCVKEKLLVILSDRFFVVSIVIALRKVSKIVERPWNFTLQYLGGVECGQLLLSLYHHYHHCDWYQLT